MHVSNEPKPRPGDKRTRTEDPFAERDQDSPSQKRPRTGSRSETSSQSTFWDQLSKVQLTKRALDELNRQSSNHSSTFSSSDKVDCLEHLAPDEVAGVKRLSRVGGPDLRDLTGYSYPMSQRGRSKSRGRSTAGRSRSGTRYSNRTPRRLDTPDSSLRTASERRSSAYDGNFEQALIDAGIYPSRYPGHRDRRPRNWNAITSRLEKRRGSVSRLDEEAFDDFVQKDYDARSEKTVMSTVFPLVRGSADIPFGEDKLFGNLDPLAEGVVSAKPDFYDGSSAEDCDQAIRQLIGSSIIPSTQEHLPIAPNFFCEGKGPDGSHAVGERQALYNGALGARAMHTLQRFGNAVVYDNNAYTITSLYHCGQLELYTVHPVKSAHPGRETDYQMTPLKSYSLKGGCDTLRQGIQAFRNARDWAKEQRDRFISNANATAATMSGVFRRDRSGEVQPSTFECGHSGSDTSTDELARPLTRGASRKRVLSDGKRLTGPPDREKSSRVA